jgi:hypothetical protein
MALPLFRRALTALLLLGALTGCATAQLYAYKNPELAGTQYPRVAVYVNSFDLGLRQRLESRVCQTLAPTPCTPVGELVFPGSVPDLDGLLDALEAKGQPAVLVIQIGQDQSHERVGAVLSNTVSSASGSAYTQGQRQGQWQPHPYGGGTYTGQAQARTWAQASGSATTITAPIMYYSRHAQGDVMVLDVHTGKVAWKGSLVTQGEGALAVTEASFERAQAVHLAQSLHASGLFPPVGSAAR